MLGLRRGPGGWEKREGAVAAEEGFLESQARERSRCIPGMLAWRLWGGGPYGGREWRLVEERGPVSKGSEGHRVVYREGLCRDKE